MTSLPILETPRLQVRPLSMADLAAVHQILDVELAEAGPTPTTTLAEREHWLQWTVLGYDQFAQLHQPPYGERAVTWRATGQLIGLVGYAPCLDAFDQLPHFSAAPQPGRLRSPEVGLYYAMAPAFQGQGYATEAAQAMIEYAFQQLQVKRVVATTTYDNMASQAVMRKLGMRLERNPFPDPSWLQMVGLLENHELYTA